MQISKVEKDIITMQMIYKMEQDPQHKQQLLKIVNQIKMQIEFDRLDKICRCDEAQTPRCGYCKSKREGGKVNGK